MPKIDLSAIPPKRGSDYPSPHDRPLDGREVRCVSQAGGLVDFNANHVIVPPGAWSSQRHWHEGEDEIAVVLSGEGVLIDEHGRHTLHAGDIATFPKGEANGHKIVNEDHAPLVLLAISRPEASPVHYADIDLIWSPEGGARHRDGTPYT